MKLVLGMLFWSTARVFLKPKRRDGEQKTVTDMERIIF